MKIFPNANLFSSPPTLFYEFGTRSWHNPNYTVPRGKCDKPMPLGKATMISVRLALAIHNPPSTFTNTRCMQMPFFWLNQLVEKRVLKIVLGKQASDSHNTLGLA